MTYDGGQIHTLYINAHSIQGLTFGPDKETAAVGFPDLIEIVKKYWTPITSFQAVNPKHLYIDSTSRLLYTEANVVKCKTLDGKDCFTTSNSKITDIGGMTIDEKGNIFVSSPPQNAVYRISTVGSVITEILGTKDGLSQPSLISISKDSAVFYVVNQNTEVLIFHRV